MSASTVQQFADDDLITCGICNVDIDNPKSLLCLHTYCRRCLTEWSKKSGTKDEVTCPPCREATPLPPGGVDGLRSNFFVTKLKDRKALNRQLMDKDVKIVCTSCDVSEGSPAVARCMECDDFLCDSCLKGHKSFRLTKDHSVYTIVELRSGKVSLVRKSREDHCKEHKGQVLWFYCKTCDVPLCRDCTVVGHPSTSHELVKLDAATSGQREEIKRWVSRCQGVKKEIEDAFQDLNQMRQKVESNCNTVNRKIDNATRKMEEVLRKEQRELKMGVAAMKSSREKSASVFEDELQLLSSRLNTALEMATQVSSEGSDCDVASAYKSLVATLTQLAKIKASSVDLGGITFEEESRLQDRGRMIGKLGEIAINRRERKKKTLDKKKWDKPWKMVKKFGDAGAGKLKDARGVAINQDGDAAVADFDAARVYVYSIKDGKMKMSIDTTNGLQLHPSHFKSHPYGVTVWKDKYLVCDFTPFPSVYDRCGNFVRQLDTPNCTLGHTHNLSISSNSRDQVMFSCYHNKHICFSNVGDDKDASSITAPILAYYIVTSSDDNKIIISANGQEGAQVIDTKGQTIHVLSPPTRVSSSWCPSGVCTICEGDDEEVFICNRSPAGVYRFSLTTGRYLGCVTTDVSDSRGIAATDDGRIVVAEETCVKVFAPSD